MEKCFCLGLAVGMVAGALLTVNSAKFRKFVCDSQKQVKEEAEKLTEVKGKGEEKNTAEE